MRLDWGEVLYYNNTEDFGWSLQIPSRFLELGRVSVTPGGSKHWYLEWRIPFKQKWHSTLKQSLWFDPQ